MKFTLPVDPPETVELTGKAVGFYVKAMNAFNIVVADAALDPELTCEMVAHPKPTKGGLIDIWFADAHPKVGKTEIPGAAVVRIDPVEKAVSMGNALTEKVTADFKAIDQTSFTVEISSAADARGPASGTIVGTMCPDVEGTPDASSEGNEGPVSKPTCDWLATPSKAGRTGNVTILYATAPKLAPGFFDVPTGEAIDLATGANEVERQEEEVSAVVAWLDALRRSHARRSRRFLRR